MQRCGGDGGSTGGRRGKIGGGERDNGAEMRRVVLRVLRVRIDNETWMES